eukprot:447133-Prymnesium_polylepis.1
MNESDTRGAQQCATLGCLGPLVDERSTSHRLAQSEREGRARMATERVRRHAAGLGRTGGAAGCGGCCFVVLASDGVGGE